jgi:hypothetical protein
MTGKQTHDRQAAKSLLNQLCSRAIGINRRVELGAYSASIEEFEDVVFASAAAHSATKLLEQSLETLGFSNSTHDSTWVGCVNSFRETHNCSEEAAIAVILTLGSKLTTQAKALIEDAEQVLNGERTMHGDPVLVAVGV